MSAPHIYHLSNLTSCSPSGSKRIRKPRCLQCVEVLLEIFGANHDPTQLNRQGPDIGTQYRSAIFFHTPEQEAAARASKENAQKGFEKPIVTEIIPISEFYRAEEYHQRYFKKNRPARFFSF